MLTYPRTIFALLLAAASLASCQRPDEPKAAVAPVTPVVRATSAGEVSGPRPAPRETPSDRDSESHRVGIAIPAELRRACGMDDGEAYFAFDSAALRPEDGAQLGKLADCFASGPMRQKTVTLVGHADPRGPSSYNLALGHKRADAVAAFLRAKGVPPERVASTSRGAREARGTDEASYAKDRRVDVGAKGERN